MESPELYIPDEELVDAVVDARALTYIPSPALVARVLAGNARRRPRFRFPASVAASQAPSRSTPRRAAAATLTILGLSPKALAAATVVHLAVFGMTGWFVGQVGRIGSQLKPPAAHLPVQERLTYVDVDAVQHSAPQPVSARRLRGLTSTTTPVPEPAAPGGRGGEGREERPPLELIRRAFNGEVVFEGDGGRLSGSGREQLQRIAAALARFPEARIVALAERTPGAEELLGRTVRQDAEALLRFFGERGARERISVEFSGAPHPMCAESDLQCRAQRRIIRIHLAEPFAPPQ